MAATNPFICLNVTQSLERVQVNRTLDFLNQKCFCDIFSLFPQSFFLRLFLLLWVRLWLSTSSQPLLPMTSTCIWSDSYDGLSLSLSFFSYSCSFFLLPYHFFVCFLTLDSLQTSSAESEQQIANLLQPLVDHLLPVEDPIPGTLCCTHYEDGQYYRARVIGGCGL